MKTQRLILAALVVSAFTYCTGTADISQTNSAVTTTTATAMSGRFIDGPVQGVQYSTATQSGLTDANGAYKYLPGEQVTFSIGKTVLGSGAAAAVVTPENLSATGTGLNDQSVKNLLRFLQTVDADGVHENGIEIKQTVRDLLAGTSINFNQTTANFDNDNVVKAVVQVSRGSAVALVSEATATANFLAYRFSGSFSDNYAGKHVLTATSWKLKDTWTDQTDTIVKINGIANYIVIQKSAADAFNASKYQKIIYIANNDGSFYTCTLSPFNSANQAAAEAITDTTVKTAPETTGCSGFSWTKMTPVNHPLIGNYTDNYAGTHRFTQSIWENYGCVKTIISYDNIAETFIYQESGDASCYNPNKYGKVYWTQLQANGSFHYCENVYAKTTAAAAATDPSPPSPGNLAGGCGGFAWSAMTKN